jgi:hypothetical protein
MPRPYGTGNCTTATSDASCGRAKTGLRMSDQLKLSFNPGSGHCITPN